MVEEPTPAPLDLIVRGAEPYARGTSDEPSLLPELARRCRPDAVGGIVTAADVFGREIGHPLAWPQIREATMLVVLRRFGRDDLLDSSRGATNPDEVDTWRVVLGDLPGDALRARLEASSDREAPHLLARIVAAVGDPDDIARFVADHPARDLEAGAIRALAEAAARRGTTLPPAWLDAAVDDDGWLRIGRAAHLMAVLPDADRRTTLATRIIDELHGAPPWFVALAASAVARDAPDAAVAALLDGDPYPPIWTGLIRDLFAADHSATADGDLARAHPFHAELAGLEEGDVTAALLDRMLDLWGGSAAMAAPEPGSSLIEPTRDSGEPTDGADGAEGAEGADDAGAVDDAGATDAVDDRRLGVDVVAGGTRVERALIRDALTEFMVSIGPPGSAGTQLGRPTDIDFGDAERLTLPVTLYDDEGLQTGELKIWRDPTTRADVTFDIIPRGDRYHATIVVYGEDGSSVIQAAAFAAQVVDSAAAEAVSERTFQLVEVAAGAVGASGAGERVGSIVTDDRTTLSSSPGIPIHAFPTGAVQGVAPLMASFRTAASNFVHTGGAFDITPTLIAAARLGFRLRRALQLDPLRDMDRIQIVPLSPAAVFPLELVYDGAPPDLDAATCTDWTTADATGRCPTCIDLEDTRTVCPLRFWGLTKAIEHHYAERTPRDPTVASAPFVARVQLGTDRQLEVPSHALIGVSDEVAIALGVPVDQLNDTNSADRIDALTAALREVVDAVTGFGQCEVADDWTDWREAVQRSAPGLLIAMPHQEGDSLTEPSLELGGIAETTLLERDVRPPGSTPGPVVLLLGCDTSNAPNLLASFASDMRHYAPVVVATIGRVVAAEAPHVAAKIVERLVAERTERADIATALIEARRALLAEGRLVGLQLIAHGDARWSVPTPH